MTKELAIRILRGDVLGTNEQTHEAVFMAIRALKAEPKHGRWIWNNRLGEWYCSECDRIMNPYVVEKSEGEYEMAQPQYCGWCGAKMDEVKE